MLPNVALISSLGEIHILDKGRKGERGTFLNSRLCYVASYNKLCLQGSLEPSETFFGTLSIKNAMICCSVVYAVVLLLCFVP